jgi:hypothetical protein
MDNQVQMDQGLTIELESDLAEADKENGLMHGALAVAVVEQAEQEFKVTFTLQALEDTLDTLADQETHQKVHQAEDQVLPMEMTLVTEAKEDRAAKVYTD